MLELKNITKDYPAGNGTVSALRGVSLSFRKSEFVAVLGPSGCGKTTMLNILGGLDQYTTGDLVIGGVSTRDFHDREWDAYRNHSVGFVFQSYNLIPHQTVLQNVELALSLSGVSRTERRRRARQALIDVGLGDQLNKRPGEMSGGQMQRVAIARALVNDPAIILADEPTGALDSETSIAVMDILKQVSRERLVVMVTHNPDLAERYATRVVRMLDGRITDDSAPLTEEEAAAERQAEAAEADPKKKTRLPSLSFGTAFGLSLKNLFTKKGRTLLTAFAGSIGIIGIALIFAVSQGTTNYINDVQEDTLSSYPLTLESRHIDIGTLLTTFMDRASESGEHERDAVYEKSMVYDLINSLNTLEETENDLGSFKAYLDERLADEDDNSGLRDALSGVGYAYDMDLLVYTENVDGSILRSDTTELMRDIIADYMGMDTSAVSGGGSFGPMSSLMSSGSSYTLWQEILPQVNGGPISDLVADQYDVIYGSWPDSFDEIVLVLDENNELNDLALYALGLVPRETIDEIMNASASGEEVESEHRTWSYEEICSSEYRLILPGDCFVRDEVTGLYSDLRDSEAGLTYLYKNGIPLHVSGIVRPNEDAISAMLTGSIGYTHLLTETVLERTAASEAVNDQREHPDTDLFTGLPFRPEGSLTDEEKAKDFRLRYEGMSEDEKAELYSAVMSIPSEEILEAGTAQYMAGMTRETMEAAMLEALTAEMGIDADSVASYLAGMSDEELTETFVGGVREQIAAQYAAETAEKLSALSVSQLAAAMDQMAAALTDEQCAAYYDSALTFSDSSLAGNLERLGEIDPKKPASINLYASTFENKDVIEDAIRSYNDSVEELSRLSYTDYIGIMMSSVTTIINAVTYVLIAFVAISLIVSSIMIGVITLISVQERTKEIGILRAIGASKRNVSAMFNAETMIIGFVSGVIGVGITWLLCLPINALLRHLTGISNLRAVLPLGAALILVAISTLLTLIAGLIPSRSAARKDPVVALRSE